MKRLHPRIQLVWMLHATVLAVVLGGVAAVGQRLIGLPDWVVPLAVGTPLVVGIPFAIARYRRWAYEIRDDALYIERGVITEVRTVVPFVRIQHVDSRRSPLDRLVGLANTVVYTAGSRGTDVRLPGLTRTDAESLRERLKQLAILTEGEDAV